MNPSNKYLNIMLEYGYVTDDAQQHALTLLDNLQTELVRRLVRHPRRWWQKLIPIRRSSKSVRGIYLWGGVGRGKTFLMDIFYQCLPIELKHRVHFHQFMNEVHQALKQLGDIENPLQQVAKDLAKKARVLCLMNL